MSKSNTVLTPVFGDGEGGEVNVTDIIIQVASNGWILNLEDNQERDIVVYPQGCGREMLEQVAAALGITLK